jgi:hypothetical protein
MAVGNYVNAANPTILSTAPRIVSLNVSASNVSIGATASATRATDGAVDVAYGAINRYLAIGRVPVDESSPARVVLFSGNAGSSSAPTENLLPAANINRTHTEPRIAFSVPTCSFLAAWPQRDGDVILSSFDLDGSLINQINTGIRSLTPVEIACRTHATGLVAANAPTATCKVYVQNIGSRNQNYYNGSFEVFDVSVSLGTGPLYGSCDIKAGRGQVLTTTSAGWANTGAFFW